MLDYSALFGCSPNPYMVVDPMMRFVEMNDAYLRVTGRTRAELLGANLFDAFPGDPDDPDGNNVRALRASLQRVFDTGEAHTLGVIRYAIPVVGGDGRVEFEERFWSATHTPLRGPDGAVAHVLQHTVDVTELQRLKAELGAARRGGQSLAPAQIENGMFERARRIQLDNQALEAERRHLLRLFDEAPGFMAYLSGPEHVYELVNGAYLALIGHRDVIGLPIRTALPDIDGQGFYELLDGVYRSGKPYVGSGVELQIERAGGRETVWVDFIYQPVSDAHGATTGILVQGHDVTVAMRAQRELDRYRQELEDLVQARTQALERSEAALMQARKLEDLGKLTGGVAHDFNNVLQVIAANLQLLDGEPLAPAPRGFVGAAMQGVERGARLASQLLSFARRQPLQPEVLDLGERLSTLQALLRGTLGEAIELRLEASPGTWPVRADPHQLDNALLNLALNARDAMQGHGRLRVSVEPVVVDADVEELAAGEYALLRVADTGRGMSPDVLAHAFEPFFTTKEVGQGTGLGLSMVYGFAKQSGGHVAIRTAPGEGTEVRLWLPRGTGTPQRAQPPLAPPMPFGVEAVLVVEDDAAVRTSVVGLVRGLGYRVHVAIDGDDALRQLQDGVEADLLFTDVVMPGTLSGVELARRARALRPGLALLFTSGFAQDALDQDGDFDGHVPLLAKPYRRDELARRLREALDAAPRARGALRVLLVEDDPDNRVTTAALLRALGHAPQAVESVEDALAALRAARWDVVMTDLHLRGASGADLAAQVRRSWPRVRVVVASGAARGVLDGLGHAHAWLQKPFSIESLQQALGAASGPAAMPALAAG